MGLNTSAGNDNKIYDLCILWYTHTRTNAGDGTGYVSRDAKIIVCKLGSDHMPKMLIVLLSLLMYSVEEIIG